MYRQQPFRIPNYLAVQRIFRKNKYDCIICSTEGPMGFAALYLKKIFGVKTIFYLYTDWLMFAKQVLKFEKTGLTRLQRIMRLYYNRFDGIFVLNSDQYSWLIGKSMKFDASRVFLTAHWVDQLFRRTQFPKDSGGYPPRGKNLYFCTPAVLALKKAFLSYLISFVTQKENSCTENDYCRNRTI